ncbi:MAG: hypothetical protein CMG71_07650 [Candidatus Marinimicrobia bacterium]|nr:hypothetical protein [Candidatus Neomarinimicrobiota bacterium]
MRSRISLPVFLVFTGFLVSPAMADHDSYMKKMVALDGTLYVTTSYYGSSGYVSTLWSYDGSTMTELTDLANSWVNHIQAVGSKLAIFMGRSIYTYDPSAAADSRITQIVSGSNYYENFVTYNSKIYFTYSSSSAYYLASFDGTTLSTGVNIGTNWPQSFVTYNSKIFWLQSVSSNYYLYNYDGTSVTNTNQYLSSYPQGRMNVLNNKLIIAADNKFYAYDDTAESPTIAYKADIGTYPSSPAVVGDRLYFSTYSSTTGNNYLKYFDGSSVSSASFVALSGSINGMIAYSGRPIFYFYNSNSDSYKLGGYYNGSLYNLASDTENDPPSKAADLVASNTGTWLHSFYEYNGTLYWMKDQNALWKYKIATIEFSSGYPFAYNVSSTSLDISVKTDKDGKVYYVVLADGATAPTSAQVKAGTDASGTSVTSGNQTISADEAGRLSISSGLSTSTAYDIYVVAEDKSENLQSSPTKVEATTTATALAVFAAGYPAVTIASTGTSGTLKVKTDKLSHVYYVVLADGTTAPTSAQIKNEADGSTNVLSDLAKGYNETVEANTETSLTISGLTASTEYDLWVVLEYDHTLPSSPTLVDISTDRTAPTVATGYPSASSIGQTDFTLSMKANENSTAYFVVLADGDGRPDTTNIKNGNNNAGSSSGVYGSGSFSLKADTENSQSITGLTAGKKYDVWVAVEDVSLNSNIATAVKKDVETLAAPVVITVKKDGSGDHPTIQEAINSITSTTKQDTVEVYDGTYEENIDFGGRNIVVRSKNGPEKTIIQPSSGGTWKAIAWFQGGEPATAKLVGFTLQNGGSESDGSAINIEGSSATIENCIITKNPKWAVRVQDSGSKIVNTLVHGNTGDGTFLFDTYTTTNYPSIINCTIADNEGYGLKNIKSYQPTVTNAIIYGNSSGGVLGNFALTYSIAEGSYSGTGNTSRDPVFSGISRTKAADYHLTDYSPAIGTGTVVNNVTPSVDIVSATRGTPPDIGAYENSRVTPLSDTTVPTVSHVREGTTGNLEWVGVNSQLSAHWNGSDGASGIKKYEYALDTSATNINGIIVPWTSTGTDTSVTMTGLTLQEGKTYYVSVRATDMLNNVSSVVTSDGVKLDVTAPSTGSIVAGTDTHLMWTKDTTSVTATWTGFTDGGSGIKEYEVMLRDETTEADETQWFVVSGALTHAFTGLDLDNNSKYFIKVRATDKVGNISSEVSSTNFQVDSENPTVTTVFETVEGVNEDISWFGPDDEIIHRWNGADNGSILQYHFAIGTAEQTDDVFSTTNVGLDTMETTLASDYDEGVTYYTNIEVKDKADNLSGIVASNGFQVDMSPPDPGTVSDGDADDMDFSDSKSTMTVNWEDFEDDGSGLDRYLVSLGTSPGDDDVRADVEVIGDTKTTFTDLSLDHGETYFFNILAIDLVGNVSEPVSSDGFTVDEYPGPPEISDISPESGLYLSLISDGELIFHFSEPLDYGEVEVVSTLGSDISSGWIQGEDSVVVTLYSPLVSLDTIEVVLSQLTDMSGRVAEDTLVVFYTEMLADYNHDLVIDAADLSTLVTAWTSGDAAYELGPVTGEAPHFVPQPDGEYDLRDVMAYTRMWHWNHGTPQLLNLARATAGEEVVVSLDENSLNVTVPESAAAGQLAFQISGTETFITMPEEKSGQMILLSHSEPALKQSLMDFAYLTGEGNRHFVLPLEFGRESSTITLAYVLYAADGEIAGEGVKTFEVTPLPAEFVLDQNYPNPFNPTTRIEYGLPLNSTVNLTVYDLLGQEVRSLMSRDEKAAGYHNIIWDARDNGGRAVSAGVYIYRLLVRGDDGQRFATTKKMVLLK